MTLPLVSHIRAIGRRIAQAFDVAGSFNSPEYQELRSRTREQALARDWANVMGDWDRAVRRCATAHGE